MNNSIEVDFIFECIKEFKTRKSDISFLMENLNIDKRKLLEEMINESKIKVKRNVKEKKEGERNIAKGVITVFNNPALVSEFAVVLGKQNKDMKIAVLESDRLNPQLDVHFNTDRIIKGIYTHLDVSRTTSLNLLVDAIHKKNLTKSYVDNLALKVNGYKNISFFTGSYILSDYEYYKLNDFKIILKFLRLQYDVVLVSTNNFIYDAFTCLSLIESDLNLIGVHGSLPKFMEVKSYFDLLEEKQGIGKEKNLYIMFDYNRKHHINESLIKQYIPENYLGNISYNNIRKKGIIHHYPYLKNISKKNMNQYSRLTKKIMKRL